MDAERHFSGGDVYNYNLTNILDLLITDFVVKRILNVFGIV